MLRLVIITEPDELTISGALLVLGSALQRPISFLA